MKKVFVSIIVLAGLILKPLEASTTVERSITYYNHYYSGEINSVSRTFYVPTQTRAVLKGLTVYNPTQKQCDATPLVTACNSKIDKEKLYHQQIRWMALSRDLLKRWNGKFQYGDTVLVDARDPSIDGFWIIKDTMNKRYQNQGDLLFDENIRTLGRWRNVEITRIKSVTILL